MRFGATSSTGHRLPVSPCRACPPGLAPDDAGDLNHQLFRLTGAHCSLQTQSACSLRLRKPFLAFPVFRFAWSPEHISYSLQPWREQRGPILLHGSVLVGGMRAPVVAWLVGFVLLPAGSSALQRRRACKGCHAKHVRRPALFWILCNGNSSRSFFANCQPRLLSTRLRFFPCLRVPPRAPSPRSSGPHAPPPLALRRVAYKVKVYVHRRGNKKRK